MSSASTNWRKVNPEVYSSMNRDLDRLFVSHLADLLEDMELPWTSDPRGDPHPPRSVIGALVLKIEWQHELGVSSSTVLDLTRRASDWLRPHYEKILQKIMSASVLYVDETSMDADGKTGWVWTFVADDAVLFAMRMSRGKKVLEDVLGDDFQGKIVADGWRSYPAYTSNLQRCWAHLLREADDLKDGSEEGKRVASELHRIYDDLTKFVERIPRLEKG